jgi:hypothetical protein
MARTNIDGNSATAATRQIWQRARQTAQDVKPVAAQVKPLASDTKAAASRGLYKARVWAAPQVDRTGQVLQDTVAPKVAAALHSSAQRLDPDKPKRNGWRIAAGISALIAVAAAVAAALRNRTKPTATAAAEEEEPAPIAESANTDGAKADAARTS